jgi:hypothetical protein
VVEVEFDPRVISYEALVRKARERNCASKVYTRSDAQQETASAIAGKSAVRSDEEVRPDKEPKYRLRATPLRHVPMFPSQAARVNAALGRKKDPNDLLSANQIALAALIRKDRNAGWPMAIDAAFVPAWDAAQKVASALREY